MTNLQELEDFVGCRVRLTRDDGKRFVGRLQSVAKNSVALFGHQVDHKSAGPKLHRIAIERVSNVEDFGFSKEPCFVLGEPLPGYPGHMIYKAGNPLPVVYVPLGADGERVRDLVLKLLNSSAPVEQPDAVSLGDGLIPQSTRGDLGRQANTVGEAGGVAPSMTGLLPMDQAPRDGTQIIVKKVGGYLDIVCWMYTETCRHNGTFWVGLFTTYVSGEERFVGWCPLPEALRG